ncbi:molecular chaperone HtpG [bacterium]|nr:molecular chaperone HtpG [candidate division CSSED10-310 bacterium]
MTNDTHAPDASTSYSFQAEVAKVLDIVINSLYTDKEIFLRELISNAVDALEKRRYLDLVNGRDPEKDLPLQITIAADSDTGTLTVTDTGIGMTRDELIENLGTIAHSGATEFLKKASQPVSDTFNLIGQFGVGFYSAFMVASQVIVTTRSATSTEHGYQWTSDGISHYTITPADGLPMGTSIQLTLKKDAEDYAKDWRLRDVIHKYSGFVPFPILINNEKVNTIQALWVKSPGDVTDDEYQEFFKYIAPSTQNPIDWLHFSTDAPLSIKALLFIPNENPEKLGFGRTDANINLHCKKVLIQRNAKDLLPLWLRFVSGVVDSEDIPLNISRETMQDSALIRKINRVLSKRIIKQLKTMAEKQPDRYRQFWSQFGMFIKEGVITEFSDRDALAELVRFETSMTDPGTLVSFQEYMERMPESQKSIYYIAGAGREAIEAGPYVEVFRKRGIEVIYNYDPVDDFVMHHLAEFKEKKLVSADSESIDLPTAGPESAAESDSKSNSVPSGDIQSLADWIRAKLQEKIADVRSSDRLVSSPIILVNPDGALTGAMQKLMEAANKEFSPVTRRNLQFNPNHPIIRNLNELRRDHDDQAAMILDQLFDHAALDAGMAVETRLLVRRVTSIIEALLEKL